MTPACLCNCRAETVPAHRTVIIRAAKSVALLFLPMLVPFEKKHRTPRHPLPNYFTGFLTGPGSLTHPPVVPVRISQMQAPLQCTVVLHAPLQTGSRLACVRSCRAETVPAQRTAAAIPVKIMFLIVLPIVR